jgi:hypothetical protein
VKRGVGPPIKDRRRLCLVRISVWMIIVLAAAFVAMPAIAQDDEQEQQEEAQQQQQQDRAKRPKTKKPGKGASSTLHARKYQVVLDGVLAAFAADAKQGVVRSLKRYAIRRISLGERVPRLHARYIQTAFLEKLMEASKGRLVVCPPCSQQTTALVEGKLLISSPASNASQIDQAAKALGIEHFVDVVFILDRTHIGLAVQVIEANTKTLAWSKTYDSELIGGRDERQAELDRMIATSRGRENYVPEFGLVLALGGAGIPNVAGTAEDSQMLAVQLRGTESFARKTDKFGLALSYYKSTVSTVKEYPSDKPTGSGDETKPKEKILKPIAKPFQQAAAVHATYAVLLAGDPEYSDQPRYFAGLGVGALAAVGYLAPAVRLGLDAHFGRVFLASVGAHYFAPTTVNVADTPQKTAGGAGGELLIGVSF